MTFNGIPLPERIRPSCGNCRRNVSGVCRYAGCGNSQYPPDWKGQKITWSLDEHCGQHQYQKTENKNKENKL